MQNFIAILKAALAKHEASTFTSVVYAYMSLVDGSVAKYWPIMSTGYSGVGRIVVDKTFENPAPALALLSALDQCAKHYGPELGEWLKAVAIKLDSVQADPLLETRAEILATALDKVIS